MINHIHTHNIYIYYIYVLYLYIHVHIYIYIYMYVNMYVNCQPQKIQTFTSYLIAPRIPPGQSEC